MEKSKIYTISENLLSVYPMLTRSISKPMRTMASITPGGMFVMGSLKRHGILSMTDIGKCLSMPKPHVTVIIDKLIDEGYVERKNDPNDRRVINIVLTEIGLKNYESIKVAISETLSEKLILLSDDELNRLSIASLEVKNILNLILSKDCNGKCE